MITQEKNFPNVIILFWNLSVNIKNHFLKGTRQKHLNFTEKETEAEGLSETKVLLSLLLYLPEQKFNGHSH